MEIARGTLNRWERGGSVLIGGGLLLIALRGDRVRRLLLTSAAALLARGATGYCPVTAMTRGDGESDTKETLGGPRGVHVQTSVTLAWPRHEVYRWWRTLTNLPAVFRHVRRIEALEGDRTRWAVAGPAGLEVSWDAEIINDVPDTLIGWRSLRGSDVSSAGSVHFNDAPGHGTTVTVRLQYEPPAGKAGAWVASLFGADAETQIREDLEQLQRQIAMGETPAETSSGRSSAHV